MTVKSYILSNSIELNRLEVQSQQATIANNVSSINVMSSMVDTSKITSAVFGSNCVDIQPSCCINCSNLKSVSLLGDVVHIGDRAFYGCASIKNIVVPQTTTSIGKEAFRADTNLASIALPTTNKTAYGQSCFYGCTALKDCSIYLNESASSSLFQNCTALTSAVFNGHIVGEHAFDGDRSLRSIDLQNVKQICQYAFKDCTSLTSIPFKSSLKKIEQYAFQNCTSLTNGNLSATALTSLSDGAFSGTGISTLTLPSTISALTMVPSNMLVGSSVSTVIFNGFTDDYIRANRGSFTQFGADHALVIVSSSGKKYKTYAPPQTGLKFDECFCIIETAMTGSGGLTDGCKNNLQNMYDMVNAVYKSIGRTSDITYDFYIESGYVKNDKVAGHTVKEPTKANVSTAIKNALRADYGLVIIYMMDHGSGSYIGVKGGSISGTELAEWIRAGNPETRILLICDCCHAAGMAPFKASTKKGAKQSEAPQTSVIENLFNELDAVQQQRIASGRKGLLAADRNPNPTILGWYTCEANHYGWMGSSGAYFLCRLVQLFKTTDTYKSFFTDKVAKTPYSYSLAKSKRDKDTYYGYTDAGTIKAYHQQYNYKNKFDTSLQVYT